MSVRSPKGALAVLICINALIAVAEVPPQHPIEEVLVSDNQVGQPKAGSVC